MTQKQKKKEEKESESEYLPEKKEEKEKKTKKRIPLKINKTERLFESEYKAKVSNKNQADLEKKSPEERSITRIKLGETVKFSTDVGSKSFGTIEKAKDSCRDITTIGLEYSRNFKPSVEEKQVVNLKQKPSDRSRTIPPKYKTQFNAEVESKEFSEPEKERETEEGETQSVKSSGLGGRKEMEDTIEEESEIEPYAKGKSLGIPRNEPYIIFLRGDNISYELWSRLLLEEIEDRGYGGSSHELDLDSIKGNGNRTPDIKDLERNQRFIKENRLLKVRDFSIDDLEEILENNFLRSFFNRFLGRGDGLSVMLCKVSEDVYLDDRITGGKIIRDELWQRLKQMERKGNQIIFYSMNLLGAEKEDRMESLASILDVPKDRNFPITQLIGDGKIDEIGSEWTNILARGLFEYGMLTSKLTKDLDKDIYDFGDTDTESLQHIAMKMLVYQILLTERNLKATLDNSKVPNEQDKETEEGIEIEYSGERKIGDLYVQNEGLWVEVETGRLIREMEENPEEYIYRKMINLQTEGEKISNLWIVLPLRKLFTWGEDTLRILRRKVAGLLENKGVKDQQVRIKFCDFRNNKLLDFQSP